MYFISAEFDPKKGGGVMYECYPRRLGLWMHLRMLNGNCTLSRTILAKTSCDPFLLKAEHNQVLNI